MNTKSLTSLVLATTLAAASAGTTAKAPAPVAPSVPTGDWLATTISPVTSPEGLFDDRITADLIWRF